MRSLSPQQVNLINKLLLGAVLVLAFFMAGIPHWNYLYPLHLDEWMHYGEVQSLMDTGRIAYPDPYNAGETLSPDVEIGFHLWLGELEAITGMSWRHLFRFFPGIVLVLLALQVYALSRGGWPGLSAAFLIALTPTTVRFLGPSFLVPVALSLSFIPLTLLILRDLGHNLTGVLFLFLALFSLLFIHPPTFFVVSLVAVVHLTLFLLPNKNPVWKSPLIVITLLGIFTMYVFLFLWGSSYVDFTLNEALNLQSELPLSPIGDVVSKLGYIPSVLFSIGIGIIAYNRNLSNWAMVISSVGLLAFQFIFPRLYFGPDIVYERGWLYIYVFMAIVGGTTIGVLWQWFQRVLRGRVFIATFAKHIIIFVLLASAFAFAFESRLTEPYYHLVDDAVYQELLWTKEHVSTKNLIGVTDYGWASPFAAVSGKYTYTGEVAPSYRFKGKASLEFLQNNARDTQWFLREGITIVFSAGTIENERLIKVNEHLYLLID